MDSADAVVPQEVVAALEALVVLVEVPEEELPVEEVALHQEEAAEQLPEINITLPELKISVPTKLFLQIKDH